MIEARALSKDYGATRALRGVSITISKNEVVGLLGPNGAGKTTLMKVLTGYLHPSSGTATIDGVDVVERSLEVQARIGYLPENAPLYGDMLVQEYLMMIAELREIVPGERLKMIGEAVESTGLSDFLIKPIGQLSKGYRQRVGLAQAILHRPKVLILDEPTSGLDPSQIVEIRKLIGQLAERATVLLSTHILPEVEASCERALIIAEGELRADARLDELQSADAALLALDDSVDRGEADEALESIEGVKAVEQVDDAAIEAPRGFRNLRVVGGGDDLCPKIHDLARDKGWRLAELRRERRDLEAVFREVVERGGRAA
jgi:ABC-2 type transport system ATP-binding protein